MSDYCNKSVLVTGATGLIGSHIVHELMSYGDVNVIALSRNEGKLKVCFEEYLNCENFSYLAQDVSEPIELPHDEHVDYIFHAAGPMERNVVSNRPLDVIRPNIFGTINCAELLLRQKERGINGRLVIFSSVTVYGNNTNKELTVEEKDTDITEKLENITAAYSQSKRMAEVIAHAYERQMGLDVVIARISTVYGNTKFLPDSAFYEFINKAKRNENILVNSSNAPRRDNIYIDDAVSALLNICTNGVCGEPYNVSSNGEKGNFAAVDEIAKIIANTSNKKYGHVVAVNYKVPSTTERAPGIKLDNTKLKMLGWSLHVDFAEGIEHTLDNI